MKKVIFVATALFFVGLLSNSVYASEVEAYPEVPSVSLVELSEGQGEQNATPLAAPMLDRNNRFIPITPFVNITSIRAIEPNCHTHPSSCVAGRPPGPFPISQASEVTTNYNARHRTYAFFREIETRPDREPLEIADTRRSRETLGGINVVISGFRSQHELIWPGGRATSLR